MGGRVAGLSAAANRAMRRASIASVLASWPGGLCEATHLQWRDDYDRQPFRDGGADEGMLEPAGGFDDDALETVSGEALDESCNRLLVVRDAEQQVSFQQIDVELVFADVDADINQGKLFGHGYSVLLNSGS